MKKGMFITIEGPDGAGKTTQIQRLMDKLKDIDNEIVFTREPGGTPIGEKIRHLVLDNANKEMDDVVEAMLYAASRAQHVTEKIKPALDSGKTVLCDRYVDSSIVYQGFGRQLGYDLVWGINKYAVQDAMPDLTICILTSPDVSLDRLHAKGDMDRLENEERAFFVRVYQGYLELAKRHPNRFIIVDADRDIDSIAEDVWSHVRKIFK